MQRSITPVAALLVAALLGAFSTATSTTATAAPISYGDFSDIPPGAVIYGNVTESSFSDPVPLYGAPTITGNLLDFDPMAFGVSSSGGASDFADGQLNFTVEALPGAGLTSFDIVEGGHFSFSGVTPTPADFVSASAGATVSILEVDGVALATPIPVFASGIFVTDYPTTGGAPSTGVLPWSLTTHVDLGSAITQPFVSGATKFEVAINNQLSSASSTGGTASISKKDFNIIPSGDLTPNPIPEPSSFALACLLGLAGAGYRRSR